MDKTDLFAYASARWKLMDKKCRGEWKKKNNLLVQYQYWGNSDRFRAGRADQEFRAVLVNQVNHSLQEYQVDPTDFPPK